MLSTESLSCYDIVQISSDANSSAVRMYNTCLHFEFLGAISRSKRGGPRAQVEHEVPIPLFHQKWNYEEDSIFSPIVNGMAGNVEPEYYLTDFRLVYQSEHGYKYCVPRVLALDVIKAYHDQCHPGLAKLMSMIHRRYHFSLKPQDLH